MKGFIFKGYFPTSFYAFTRLNNSFALETIFTKKLALLCVSPVVGSFCIEWWSIQNGTPVPSRSKKTVKGFFAITLHLKDLNRDLNFSSQKSQFLNFYGKMYWIPQHMYSVFDL